jgi:hypothetical protein
MNAINQKSKGLKAESLKVKPLKAKRVKAMLTNQQAQFTARC